MNYHQILFEKLQSFDFRQRDQSHPVVSLEDFFTGNDDEGSIGCNLSEHPGLPVFFEILKNIRKRENVQDVLIEITDIDNLVESSDLWAFSDRIYIITSVSRDEVASWVEPLMPDEVKEGWAYDKPPVPAPEIFENYNVYAVWWD